MTGTHAGIKRSQVGSDYITGEEPGSKIESEIRMVSGQNLYNLFRGMPVAGHGEVSPGFLFLCRRKKANLIDNIIHVTAEAIYVGFLWYTTRTVLKDR